MADQDSGASWGIFLQSDKHSLYWSLDFHIVFTNKPPDFPRVSWITLDDPQLSKYPAQQRSFLTSDLFAALTSSKPQDSVTVLRLLFAVSTGTPIRLDYIEYRLRDAPSIHSVRSFLNPLAPATGTRLALVRDFGNLELLRQSLGGIISHGASLESTTDALNSELDFRPSVPWLAPTPPPLQKRILWVQGRANIFSSQQFYLAAQALGITLVVTDALGHWIQDPAGPHTHLREAFVELNIDADAGLAQHIADAVRAYPERIDGIVTISDARLPHVAKACEILGLPTEWSVRVGGGRSRLCWGKRKSWKRNWQNGRACCGFR